MANRSRLIFQTWKSKTSFPPAFAAWAESWKKNNPRFKYILFDDADNAHYIKTKARWYFSIFKKFPREIMRADAIRYFFLFFEGGIYADMDFECLRSFAPLFKDDFVTLGQLGDDELFPHALPNALMVAPRPFDVFWLFVFVELLKAPSYLEQYRPGEGTEVATGPVMLRRAFFRYNFHFNKSLAEILQLPEINFVKNYLPKSVAKQIHNSGVRVLSPESFYPLDFRNISQNKLREKGVALNPSFDKKKRKLFPDSYAVTYWTASWQSGKRNLISQK